MSRQFASILMVGLSAFCAGLASAVSRPITSRTLANYPAPSWAAASQTTASG